MATPLTVGLIPIDHDLPALFKLLNLCCMFDANPKLAKLYIDKNILNPDFSFKVAMFLFLFILVNNELDPADLDKEKPLPG
jgi:hypothetical protein